MLFCPVDGTLLLVRSHEDQNYFYCTTCPYGCRIQHKQHISCLYTAKKAVDDILGGSAAWENVDRTAARCPLCHHHEAYFMQMQIRSADEPMSVFYKCCNCAHQWNDK